MQISNVHVAGTHWVCLTNKNCKPATVKVCDSRRTGDLLFSAEVVAACPDKKQIEIASPFIPDVQHQSDSSRCELFSLAYALTLCEGIDPAKTHYDHSKL